MIHYPLLTFVVTYIPSNQQTLTSVIFTRRKYELNTVIGDTYGKN